jgi:hypothetical protein
MLVFPAVRVLNMEEPETPREERVDAPTTFNVPVTLAFAAVMFAKVDPFWTERVPAVRVLKTEEPTTPREARVDVPTTFNVPVTLAFAAVMFVKVDPL